MNSRAKLPAACLALLLAATVLAGCGKSDPASYGGLALSFDLSLILPAGLTAALVPVVLTTPGHREVRTDLAVSGHHAVGMVKGLPAGTYTITVSVLSDHGTVFTGSGVVTVLEAYLAQYHFLLDSGWMTGWRAIDQAVDQIVMDAQHARLYLLDGAHARLGVYDADTLTHERDLNLPLTPQCLALTEAGDKMLLGCSTGRVSLLDLASGAVTTVTDLPIRVMHLVGFGGRFVLATDSGHPSAKFKSLDWLTGQVVDEHSDLYLNAAALEWNPASSAVYVICEDELVRMRLNPATGAIDSVSGTLDRTAGRPIRIINGGTRLVSGTGTVYRLSLEDDYDLRYAGSIGGVYYDLVSDDQAGMLYLISGAFPAQLIVEAQSTFAGLAALDVPGTPERVFCTPSSVLVLSEWDGKTWARVWSKHTLGRFTAVASTGRSAVKW